MVCLLRKYRESGGRKKLKTSEGTSRWYRVEYTLDKWVENFEDYLRSCMSYTNSENLTEFKESQFVFLSESNIKRINK